MTNNLVESQSSLPSQDGIRKWAVRSKGRTQTLIIVTASAIGLVFFWFGRDILENPEEAMEDIGLILILSSIFIVAWLTTVPGFVLRKKIPNEIEVDLSKATISILYSSKKSTRVHKDNLAFCFHEHDHYGVLVFYTKMKASRGHMIYKENLAVIGLKVGVGWKMNVLKEISQTLQEAEFEEKYDVDKDFFTRLIE